MIAGAAEVRRWLQLGLIVLLLALAAAWWLGCWRDWRSREPAPQPTPARVDPGRPLQPDPPAAVVTITVPAADLTKEALAAAAAKYGLMLVERDAPRAPRRPDLPTTRPTPLPESAPPPVAAPAARSAPSTPRLLAEERFCQAPDADGACPATSAQVDVAAWLLAEGRPIDLRAAWRALAPPPRPEAAVAEIRGRWHPFVGVGGLVASIESADTGRQTALEPALLVGTLFDGVRVGPAHLGGLAAGGVSRTGDVVGLGGLAVSW